MKNLINTTKESLVDLELGVYIEKVGIAQDDKYEKVVFFVSGSNGDNFGQFDTLTKASLMADFVIKYFKKEGINVNSGSKRSVLDK